MRSCCEDPLNKQMGLIGFIHYFFRVAFPGILAFIFFRKRWWKVYAILLLTMLVDLDHLLADPVYDPVRCSIGFHPLHSYPAIAFYLVLLFFRKFRILALGLVLHMATDYLDCILQHYHR